MPPNTTQLEDLDKTAPSSPPPEDPGRTLGERLAHYWRLFRAYYWIVVIACAVGAAGAYVYTRQQPEIFEAEAKIIYHQKSGNVFGKQIEQVDMLGGGGSWQFERFWKTQKEIFESRWFARRVAKHKPESETPLGHALIEDETFVPARSDRSYQERLEAVATQLLSSTRVSLKQGSRVATVTVRTRDPVVARSIANRVAREYTDYTDEFQSRGLERITEFFDKHVSSKRQKLERAQSKLQDYKQDNNILSFSYEDRQNLTSKNMESINTKLLEVRNELSAERALLRQVRELKSSSQVQRAIADLVDNETLESAFKEEAELKTELARLETRYLDKHPKVEAVSRELETIRQNIETEIERVEAALTNRVNLLERRRGNLKGELEDLRERVMELDKLGGEYAQLKNRKHNLQEMYDTVLKRASELDINSAYQSDDIEVLEEARTPEQPVSPSLPVNLAAGLALGLLAGIGGIVVIDAFDTTIRREDDITRYTDKPILATLPKLDAELLERLDTDGSYGPDTITDSAPRSSFAEEIKTLRTNLTFMASETPPQTLLVTSPGPGEGKTITSINMAIAMAQSGARTLLVDTDLRRPRIHAALELEKAPGFTSTLRADELVGEAIQSTHIDNLSCLTSGEIPENPSEMLDSEAFREFVQERRQNYDRVIFDSPPLGAVSDALIISNMVEGMLLVVEFGKTRRETLERSLGQIRGIGAPLVGIVLNEVSTDVPGYGYSYYRYSYYEEEGQGSDRAQLAS